MRFEEFMARFPKSKRTQRGFMVRCPAHDDSDKTPSLSVGRADDGGVLLKCFAGCTNEQVVASLNLTMRDLFATQPVVRFTPPAAKPESKSAETPKEKPVIEKIYSYQDALGKEVYQAIRLKPKSFRQRHRNPDFDATMPADETNKEWVWTMDGVERVLYRLPRILAAKTVWIVEGEKDVDNLVALGLEATCNVGGAGKWLDAYTECLEGREVVICGDNDEAGEKHVKLVFDSICGKAKTVKIVHLPESVKDASDYIALFKTAAEAKAALQELASQAHPHVNGHRLPIYSIAELEGDYRRFAAALDSQSLSLGRWLPKLNCLRPLVPGELVFIIGDTGTGKTGLLQQIARCALPLPTILFQLELPKELMFERFASMVSPFTCQQIEAAYRDFPGEENSLAESLEKALRNLFVCTESRLTVAQIENYVLRSELKIGERPRVVLIDYIQLIQATGPNRREKISDIAEGLKVMAKATRTIVIVASQISRPQGGNLDDWEPSLHSGKESGSIEASCGLLLSAWRDTKDSTLLHVKVLKSTKGGAGTHVHCNFNGAKMVITERADSKQID